MDDNYLSYNNLIIKSYYNNIKNNPIISFGNFHVTQCERHSWTEQGPTYRMGLTEELTTGVKRVISAWLGFAYIVSPPIVRLIGMGNSTSGQEVLTSKSMFGHWNAARENWWTSTSLTYENITNKGDALTSYY